MTPLTPRSSLYKAAVKALEEYGGQLERGTGEGLVVPDPTGDWKLVLPVFADLPMLMRLKGDNLEYRELAVKAP